MKQIAPLGLCLHRMIEIKVLLIILKALNALEISYIKDQCTLLLQPTTFAALLRVVMADVTQSKIHRG